MPSAKKTRSTSLINKKEIYKKLKIINEYLVELDEVLDTSDEVVLNFECTNKISPGNYIQNVDNKINFFFYLMIDQY